MKCPHWIPPLLLAWFALGAPATEPIANHPRVRHFRSTGMIWAFDIDTDDPHFARRFFTAALDRELLLRPLGNTVYFMPPYVIGDPEIAFLAARTAELLNALPLH